MLRLRFTALALSLLGLAVAPGCSSNDTKGGPPVVPCTDVQKGPAPICGTACTAKCGCHDCADGEELTIEGTLYQCSAHCFSPLGNVGGSGGTSAGGGGSPSGGGAAGDGGGPQGGAQGGGGSPTGGGGMGLVGGTSGAGGS